MDLHLPRLVRDPRQAMRQGSAAVDERQRTRFAAMLDHARTHSPYYRDLYKALPAQVHDLRLLPITNKTALMARFDDWATDRGVTIEKAKAFAANRELIGERFSAGTFW